MSRVREEGDCSGQGRQLFYICLQCELLRATSICPTCQSTCVEVWGMTPTSYISSIRQGDTNDYI